MGAKKLGKCCCCCFIFLVIIAVGVAVFTAYKKPIFPDPKKYTKALEIAMQFFDVQKSGKLVDNGIAWRGDSGLEDGKEARLDLSKGMYDAGDHMKFGFPMAFTATVLSWAIIEYGNQMKSVDQFEPARSSLKWITDYLINAHPTDNVLYIQVGNPNVDHGCWNRPEDMKEARPVTQVNASFPGTDVSAETAAALAAAYLVFNSTDSAYSNLLLKHAKQLFTFADKHRGLYSKSIPQVQKYYNSTGYGDELLWAAGWLYHATQNQSYLDFVTGENGEEFADWGNPSWFSWDNKLPGAQVLLAKVSLLGSTEVMESNPDLDKYRESAEAVMCGLLPKSPSSTSSRTSSGLIWVAEWNSLQHPVASAFLAIIYSDYMLSSLTTTLSCDGRNFAPSSLRAFAMSQANYVLGNNPMGISYVVGYGKKYPSYVHHRGASIPADETPGCKDGFKWLESDEPNPNIAVGALVGGPFLNETYIDSRNNSMQGEPSTYNAALIVGLLSGLLTSTSSVPFFEE